VTIAQYLRLLRNHWITVTLLTVLGTLGAGVFSFATTPAYEARVQLFVSTSGQSNSPGELSQPTPSPSNGEVLHGSADQSQILEPVINNLELGTTADQLGQRVTTSSPLDTVLIDVTVQDNSPTRAAEIANAIAIQFPKFINELETRSGQSTSPVKVSITRPAFPQLPCFPRQH
jgi:capsular polysaccharide biosynthesis protein